MTTLPPLGAVARPLGTASKPAVLIAVGPAEVIVVAQSLDVQTEALCRYAAAHGVEALEFSDHGPTLLCNLVVLPALLDLRHRAEAPPRRSARPGA